MIKLEKGFSSSGEVKGRSVRREIDGEKQKYCFYSEFTSNQTNSLAVVVLASCAGCPDQVNCFFFMVNLSNGG